MRLCPLTIDLAQAMTKGSKKVSLEDTIIDYWAAVLRLLQDDEENIRLTIEPLCSSIFVCNATKPIIFESLIVPLV